MAKVYTNEDYYEAGCPAHLVIPEGFEAIHPRAFSDCTSLVSVNIPDSVTEIGESAFIYCTSLQSVNIPESLTEIGDYAFSDCTPYRVSISQKELLKSANQHLKIATILKR